MGRSTSSSRGGAGRGQWLILAAAEGEAEAVARGVAEAVGGRMKRVREEWRAVELMPRVWLARTGVGKVNAAACAALLVEPERFAGVVNLGIAGALPRRGGRAMRFAAELMQVVVGSRSVYADEGIVTERGYSGLDAMGFPLAGARDGRDGFNGSAIDGDHRSRAWMKRVIEAEGLEVVEGAIATVSTCSGTDAMARAVAERTGGLAEAMEGAAVAHVLARRFRGRVRFVEVRIVSNTTGDRAKQEWSIRPALDVVGRVGAAMARAVARGD